jgi:hypothetical protein
VDAIRDLFGARAFGEGALAGAAAFLVVLAATWARGRTRADWAGLGFAVAALLVLAGTGPAHGTGDIPRGLTVGLGVLVAGGLVLRIPKVPKVAAVVCYAPGAIIVAYHAGLGDLGEPSWARPLVAATIIVGGALLLDVDRARARTAVTPMMFAITVVAVYVTVPDTEHLLVLAGAALALVAYTVPTPISSLGPEGIGAALGVLMWCAAVDGRGRPTSIIGASAALGLLAVDPIGRRLGRHRWSHLVRLPDEPLALAAAFAIAQGAVALYAARVVGLRHDTTGAVLLLAPWLVVAVAVSAVLPQPSTPKRRHRHGHSSRSRGTRARY